MKWHLLFLLLLPLGLSAQNVGININAPIFQLDVRSPTSSEVTFLNVASQDNAYFTRLIAGHPGAPASSLSWKSGVPLNLGMWDQNNFVYSLVMHLSPLNRVGINTFDPGFDLDVRGLENTFDGGELQLATPDQTNFLRFFGGRLGDPHPFMAFADTDTFHIVTTAADWSTFTRRMTLLPTGRVGIGTENPLAKLDIAAVGDGAELLRFTTDRPWVFRQTGSSVSTKLTLQSTVNGKIFEILSADSTNRAAVFYSSNVHSNVLLVPDGGEAGVGIEDPLAKFHVVHNSSIGWPSLRITEDDSDFARIKLETGTEPGTYWDIAGKSDSVASNASLNFFYGSPGSSGDRMSIKGNGNVGIGTTNPAEKLHVQGTFRVSDLAGTGDRNVIVDSNGKFKIGTLGAGDSDWTETASAVYNNTHDIGIGTTNPGSKLHIIGPESDGTSGALKLTYPGTAPFYIDAHSMILDGNEIDVTGTVTSVLDLQGNSGGGIRMVQGGGNVGIGTNAPTNKKVLISGSAIPSSGDPTLAAATLSLLNTSNGFSEMLLDGNEISTVDETFYLNKLTNHDVVIAQGGGDVGIGTSYVPAGYRLSVAGKVIAEELRVQLQGAWPDYVFDQNYPLRTLEQLEADIRSQQHLPGVPPAEEVAEKGIAVGEMQTMMMEKIEELTLYVLQLHHRINELEVQNAQLKTSQSALNK